MKYIHIHFVLAPADRRHLHINPSDAQARNGSRLLPPQRDEASAASNGWLSRLLSFPSVLLFWIMYGIAHALLRLGVSRSLILDDARANELTQSLEFGYQIRQPPLYEWILWSVQQALGPAIESHLVVRYGLVALIGVTTFGAVRAAAKDDRWAAVASLSLAFTYPVGWTFHEWATQTLILCAACMATLHAAIRFVERPAVRTAIFLGLAIALGLYAKFSFPLLLGGLLLAALSMPETRARLADPRLLLSVAIFLAVLAPYGWWVARAQCDIPADLASHLVDSAGDYLKRTAYGFWRLATSAVTFLLPWIAIVALLAPPAFQRTPATTAPATIAERLALRTMLFAILLTAAGILLWGATNLAARYMHAILFVAPVYIFARVARLTPDRQAMRALAWTGIVAALLVFCIRFVAVTDNALTRHSERALLIPYAGLADALAARGIGGGTVISPSVREAGNLRALLPDLRVKAVDSLRVGLPLPRPASQACHLVWMQGQEPVVLAIAPESLSTAERISISAASSGIFASRSASWFVASLNPASALCH